MHMDTIFAREFISSRMHSARVAHNVSKQAMSGILHIDPHSYADLESGKYCPSGPSLLLLLRFMGPAASLEMIQTFYASLYQEDPPAVREVTQEQLRARIAAWLEEEPARADFGCYPLAQHDVAEDAQKLVNRLYYVVPKFIPGCLDCFVFFEENTFHKDPSGDLTLAGSRLFIQ